MSIQSALVVDDSKVAHIKLRRLLEKRSITVDWVNSGEDAVTALETQTPDIVFMDILMPGMDGFETTKTILATPKNTDLAIVMCSGNDSEEDRQKAVTIGAAGYIGKPYTDDELAKVLEEVSARVPSKPAVEEAATKAPAPEPAEAPTEAAAAAPGIDVNAIVAQARAAAQQAAEETFARLGAQLRDELTAIASASGRDAAMEVAGDTAATVAQNAAQEIARATVEEVVGQRVKEAVAAMPHPSGGLDAAAVTTAIRHFIVSDDFKRQVASSIPAPALDEARITQVADAAARDVATKVSQTATRDATDTARKVAQETARIAAQEAAAGGTAGAEEVVRSAVSGLRTLTILVALGLAGVIGFLAYTNLAP
jgi:CheY-like chemotaxis protein